jgi:hypothetical protein
MTSQPVAYPRFSDVEHFCTEFVEADALNPTRGILVGIALCAPFWASVYLFVRSIWN